MKRPTTKRKRPFFLSQNQTWLIGTLLTDLRNYSYVYEINLRFQDEFGIRMGNLHEQIARLLNKNFIGWDYNTEKRKKFYFVTELGKQIWSENGLQYYHEMCDSIRDRCIKRALINSGHPYSIPRGSVTHRFRQGLVGVKLFFTSKEYYLLVGKAAICHEDILDFCIKCIKVGAGLPGEVKNAEKNKERTVVESNNNP